uniref:Predicted nuclease of the RNAse H fold, HicB family n=1 Tax=Candidatus Kentrum eta TaxID=2126337 RepID=A0A450UFG8_9GAMM|nr:MAG: Predicted nuclease of the RNAse H fold, HicB family [Candidatus Kentron sp. H]VFJ91300.1 MAG: Predicted nuclease of the RNAse H fold, HicB family [Candidatus Kentron sp. H]VFJ97820.1 MAG: Predicted nuclease of the RNAse H fold, HicB family [Candidatus Kentron sp. H]
MRKNDRYLKVVEWSEEDQCYVGQCPGVIGPCCHGDDESSVHSELSRIVDEWIEILEQDNKQSSPIPMAGKHPSELSLTTA